MNLGMLLDMAADGFPDRIVVGTRSDGFSARRLQELARGGAALVRARGADAVVYLATSGPAFHVGLFAAANAGVPFIPVNYRLGRAQLDALLANHPRAVGIVDPAGVDILEEAGIPAYQPKEWLDACATGALVAGHDENTESDAPAAVIYTSGTTSAPKGVLLHHSNLCSYVLATVEFMSAETDDAAAMSVPPYHIAGVSAALTNLFAGRRLVTVDSFTPERWLDLVREEKITNAMVVPTMLARIMQAEGVDRSVPTLKTLSYGGAKMPQSVIERALREWPEVDFVNAYGLTETSSTVTVLTPDDHRAALRASDEEGRRRLGSAGRPVPGIELEVRDAAGRVVPAGQDGEIWISGEQVSGRYAGSASSLDERGFFFTRDHGWLDDDGFLFISGRMDDTIIRGAENIAPAEIEDVLLRHPDLADVVVVGIPDEEWGQRIEAVVVPLPGAAPDTEELREMCRRALRSSKTPDRITLWRELPRTETGKLLRREVVQGLLTPQRVS